LVVLALHDVFDKSHGQRLTSAPLPHLWTVKLAKLAYFLVALLLEKFCLSREFGLKGINDMAQQLFLLKSPCSILLTQW